MGRLLLNRERELAQLEHALDGSLSGRGQMVLVAGEPGIGKTTLAQAFAAKAAAKGARVLWGRSGDREGSPPYWPWAEALRAFAEQERPRDPLTLFGPDTRSMSAVLPELRERRRLRKAGLPAGDDSERFRVAAAIRVFLQRMAQERAIVLVLDDLH